MTNDAIYQVVFGSIVGLGGAIVAVYKFVDARTEAAVAPFRLELEQLKERIKSLEDAHHAVRGLLRAAREFLFDENIEDAKTKISEAEDLL